MLVGEVRFNPMDGHKKKRRRQMFWRCGLRWGSEPLRALYAWSSIEDKKYKEDAAPGQDRAGKDEAPLWRARPDRDRGSRRRSTPLTIGLHC